MWFISSFYHHFRQKWTTRLNNFGQRTIIYNNLKARRKCIQNENLKEQKKITFLLTWTMNLVISLIRHQGCLKFTKVWLRYNIKYISYQFCIALTLFSNKVKLCLLIKQSSIHSDLQTPSICCKLGHLP